MAGLEIVIGAAVTLIVQLIKRLGAKIGKDLTVVLVFVLCFIGSAAYTVFIKDTTFGKELIESFGKILAVQFSVWALVVQYIIPKVEEKVEEM